MLEPATHRPGTVLGGKFKIERVLGAGGMGAVYEVTHAVTRHRRALKLLHPRMAANEDVVERFLREASAAGRIGDPHIVEAFDGGHLPSGEPYVLLELLEGRSLAERLKGTSGLALTDALDIVAQACDGTDAANRAGIIHRDLKPDNLFLCERQGRPFVKLLDFGVSRFDPQTSLDKATVGGGLIGTPFYMAPEQMRGDKDLDARADVYALGVILWECLTNTPPYAARDVVRLVGEVLSDDEPRIDRVRPDLPPALVELVAHAMKKRRELRIGSAAELGQGLRALLAALAPNGALGASELAATGLAATGLADARVALAPTPEEHGTDPLAATSAPGGMSEPVRVSTGDVQVDVGALTVASVPGSTPMPVSTPTPLSAPATRRAADEQQLPASKGAPESSGGSQSTSETALGAMTPAPSRSGGTLFAVGLVLSVVVGLVIAALPGTDPPPGPGSPALGAAPGAGVTATGRAELRPEVGAPSTERPASAPNTIAAPTADAVASAASSPSAPASARPPATQRAPSSRPSAKPSSTYGSKGEFPGG